MKYQSVLISVNNMDNSKKFYKEVLGLEPILDFGANVTLNGGICLQTYDTWKTFIKKPVVLGGNDAELYFEEDEFDAFILKLSSFSGIRYVHSVIEHIWGQRVVRFYDPDDHIIEVGENLKTVVKKLVDGGMTFTQVSKKVGVPLNFIEDCMK